MNEYIIVPIAAMTLITSVVFGLGYLISKDNELTQLRFEQCMAAGMQWNDDDCLK